jgi:hypothetical protein
MDSQARTRNTVLVKSREMTGRSVERLLLKEGNPISLVFQNIDPPPPYPAFVGGEDTLSGRRGGWGPVNILEDERNRALLQ